MDESRAAEVLERISAAIAPNHDLADLLAKVTAACREILGVDATGIMVLSRGGRLQLLAASSHDAAELELHQSQIDEGPCVDAAQDSGSVAVWGEDGLREKWPEFGPAMIDAGFLSVHSAPLRWNESTLGAMALFRRDPTPFDKDEDELANAFAELVARLVVGADAGEDVDTDQLTERALNSRIVVEQAKGALMETDAVSSGEAYQILMRRAAEANSTLTAAAREVLDGARS
jgi:GAF domain-containing protein